MFSIYLVKKEKMRDFGFASFAKAEKLNGEGSVRMDNYNKVYEFEYYGTEDLKLDDIYEIFNLRIPSDFKGHSMSVSDVVGCDGVYYYCDSFGWKKLDWKGE